MEELRLILKENSELNDVVTLLHKLKENNKINFHEALEVLLKENNPFVDEFIMASTHLGIFKIDEFPQNNFL